MNHTNGTFPSDNNRFAGQARYSESPVSGIHGNQTRHIAAPRVDRSQRHTMTAPRGAFIPNMQQGATVQHRRPSKPFEAKGHDAALAHCQNHGLEISVQTLNSDTKITGVIARRDRFTVTIERKSATSETSVYHEIIFKHAIESISLPEFDKSEVQ